MRKADDWALERSTRVSHGAPAAHGAQQLLVGQRVRLLESHHHNLKVVGSNPTPATITNCLAASPASVDRQPAISGIDLRMLAAGGEDLVQLADLLTVDLGHTGSEVDLSRL